jgi:hypothetical protein
MCILYCDTGFICAIHILTFKHSCRWPMIIVCVSKITHYLLNHNNYMLHILSTISLQDNLLLFMSYTIYNLMSYLLLI